LVLFGLVQNCEISDSVMGKVKKVNIAVTYSDTKLLTACYD